MALWLVSHMKTTVSCIRQFAISTGLQNTQPSDTKQTTPKNADLGLRKRTTLTGLQRWALVFSGKYKSKADVPEYVPHEVLEKARSKARIRLSNYLMLLTLFGCMCYAYTGRKKAERGESVAKMNMDWHKEYQEKAALEKAKAASK